LLLAAFSKKFSGSLESSSDQSLQQNCLQKGSFSILKLLKITSSRIWPYIPKILQLELSREPQKVFSPDSGVEALSQVLDILKYACGLHPPQWIRSGGKSRGAGILSFALIRDENSHFEMGSNHNAERAGYRVFVYPCQEVLRQNGRKQSRRIGGITFIFLLTTL
jgi:hypothetical protein